MATGSSSLRIKMLLEESMTGRKKVHEMYTLNAQEHVGFCKPEWLARTEKIQPSDNVEKLAPELHHLLLADGYIWGIPQAGPCAEIEDKIEELKEIHRSFLQKDILSMMRMIIM